MASFSKYQKGLLAVKEKIDEDITSHTSVKQLAQIAGVSKSKLKILFKNEYGKSIYTYLKEKRIIEAKHLLLNTSLLIKDIATKTGFKFHTNFATFFTKHVNQSPYSYRKLKGKKHSKD